jgi:2-polyprenyl-3-methyl-5-hydroxy-6-metoxy-1,4-benzoquinol methylase
MGGAAARWARELAEWRIPDEILAAAPQSPWIHPVELFRALDAPAADAPAADVPSRRRGLERLDEGGTVLDVGCGGGRAALALCPPAGMLTGVDHQQGMLDAFVDAAHSRGLAHGEILGDWPDVADRAPTADVVVCHHVVYNVAALPAFLSALDAHARRRVVLELPQTHPLSGMTPLWRHF